MCEEGLYEGRKSLDTCNAHPGADVPTLVARVVRQAVYESVRHLANEIGR